VFAPEWVINMAIQKKSLRGAAAEKDTESSGRSAKPAKPAEPGAARRLAVAKLATAKLSTAKLQTLKKLT
jgi:hypothetical protein